MSLLNCEQEGQVRKCLRADFSGQVSWRMKMEQLQAQDSAEAVDVLSYKAMNKHLLLASYCIAFFH